MPNVYGMDTSDFPGHAVLGWYWANCGFRYTGFYVAPAPRHRNQSWMSQRDELAAAGWGFLPVFVGLQINASGLSTANGAEHGKDAARLMTNAKFHAQTICYLDLEDGTEPSGNYAGYISAWLTALQGEGYVPGIYCSQRIADWCRRKTTISGPSDCRWGQRAIPIRQIKFQRASLPTEQSRRNTARTSSCAARRRRSTLMLLP